MRNERLVTALRSRGLTERGVAAQLCVDPKTVERWQHCGRVPRAQHRQALAALLEQPESYLWPEVAADAAALKLPGMVEYYRHRCDVPDALWRSLLTRTPEQLDVLAYAALFLTESHPDLIPALRRGGESRRIRFALGDPTCPQVAERSEEEGLDMAERIRTTLRHLRPLADCSHIEIRLHRTTLYDSLFRFDGEMLVNHHSYGVPAYRSPVLHLRRTGELDSFAEHLEKFENIWNRAEPLDLATWSPR